MKRNLLVLVAAVLLASSAHAKTFTDKTFMNVRSTTVNQPMQLATWHDQFKKDEDKCGTSLQAVGFFQQSTNAKDLGKYFSSSAKVAQANAPLGFIKDFIATNNVANSDAQFFTQDIFHTAVATAENYAARTLSSKIQFRPEHSAAGLRLDWNQRLDKITDGLFLRVTLPVTNVQTKMGISNVTPEVAQNLAGALPAADTNVALAAALTGAAKKFSDYLNGDVVNAQINSAQAALAKAKINSASHSKTAVADLDVMLGYQVYEKNDHRIGLNVAFTAPTGNKSTGEFVFEPISGNGNHWALGAGVDAEFRMWTDKKNEDRSLAFLAVLDYRYLFQATEMRTASFNYRDNTGVYAQQEMRPYLLGGKIQVANAAGNALFPLANVLTRDHNVTPGSMVQMMASFALNWDAFVLDLGYNLYYREDEKVSVRAWTDGVYGPILPEFNTVNAVTEASFQGGVAGLGSIRSTDLIAIGTPSQLTHKLFAGVGYTFRDCEYPVMLGFGGHYEFASDNSAVEAWGINGKIGVSF